jgi:hypothetical protein
MAESRDLAESLEQSESANKNLKEKFEFYHEEQKISELIK